MAVVVIESWSNTLSQKRTVEEFEYDDSEFSFSDAALKRIELLMMGNNSFSVSFYTTTDAIRSDLVNSILLNVGTRA